MFCGAVVAAILAVGLSLHLDPDPRGYGTHEGLGLPPCGMKLLTDIPCPSCGMTTSFAHSARLQAGEAFRAHPVGPILFGAVVGAGLISLAALLRIVNPERVQGWYNRFPWDWASVSTILLLLLAWSWRLWEVSQTR